MIFNECVDSPRFISKDYGECPRYYDVTSNRLHDADRGGFLALATGQTHSVIIHDEAGLPSKDLPINILFIDE